MKKYDKSFALVILSIGEMDVEKVRELLGPKYDGLNDVQINEVVSLIKAICRVSIKKSCTTDYIAE